MSRGYKKIRVHPVLRGFWIKTVNDFKINFETFDFVIKPQASPTVQQKRCFSETFYRQSGEKSLTETPKGPERNI